MNANVLEDRLGIERRFAGRAGQRKPRERDAQPPEKGFMPKGYWIVQVDLKDPEKYKGYMAATVEPFRKYRAHYLVRAGRFENADGTSRARHAVIEFPSYEAALACWKSPEYQEARRARLPVSTMDIVIVEGYEGPQPV